MNCYSAKANELTKRYGALKALDRVNFEVRRGEVVGFLGHCVRFFDKHNHLSLVKVILSTRPQFSRG